MATEDLLKLIGRQQEETEFYTPMPAGYRPGHHKYVVVVGTVMSGLGKGIFSSSLAKLSSGSAGMAILQRGESDSHNVRALSARFPRAKFPADKTCRATGCRPAAA